MRFIRRAIACLITTALLRFSVLGTLSFLSDRSTSLAEPVNYVVEKVQSATKLFPTIFGFLFSGNVHQLSQVGISVGDAFQWLLMAFMVFGLSFALFPESQPRPHAPDA